MCVIPAPSDPSHWPARVGHLQAAADAALGMLRRGNAPAAQRILEDALSVEKGAEEAFHAHLTRALRRIHE